MSRSALLPAAVGALVLSLAPLNAQEAGEPAGEAPEAATESDDAAPPSGQDDEDVPEDSAILPNAEDHEESEADTMDIDCEADAENCLDPLTEPATGPVMSSPDAVETPEVEATESDQIVADPEE